MDDCFSDWLEVNCIDEMLVRRNLVDRELPIFLPDIATVPEAEVPRLSSEEAWALSAAALNAAIPELKRMIRFVEKRVPRCLEPQLEKPVQPFTYDRAGKRLPFVSCAYRGTASDLLTVAHEFSHALQIVGSAGSTMPPLAREVCAFLGELALLHWVRRSQPVLSPCLERAWFEDNSHYFGKHLKSLGKALNEGSEIYDYGWNYPIARLLAVSINGQWSGEELAGLFRGGAQAPALLARCLERAQILPQRFVLPVMRSGGGRSVCLYRQMGSILLIDLQDPAGERAEESIAQRYAFLLKCMQTQSLFLALDRQQVPMGYVTWGCDEDAGEACPIECHAADMERLPQLLSSLERHFPEVTARLRRMSQPPSAGGAFP
ncbi:hypothetical protein [uncultured Nitratireductor sp.]|uniref:hypothetical protein n=1 Tax=uncultured Nitratireductor sp. TaxID=520953 RepID=UPI0025FBFFC7|nr:hypothetical protein [uncultured Nitratireductor sp.]